MIARVHASPLALRPRRTRIGLVILGLLAADCTAEYPSLALTWTLRESNEVDGDAARRERTCNGALIDEVEATVVAGAAFSQRFPCADGLAPNRVVVDDIYPVGHVEVTLRFVDHQGTSSLARLRSGIVIAPEVDDAVWVEAGSPGESAGTAELDTVWEPDPVDAVLTVEGTQACDALQAELQYLDPQRQLLTVGPRAASQSALTGPDGGTWAYRNELTSDRGFRFDRTVQSCEALVGHHELANIDRGAYRLALLLDRTRACELEFVVAGDQNAIVLDLEQAICREIDVRDHP